MAEWGISLVGLLTTLNRLDDIEEILIFEKAGYTVVVGEDYGAWVEFGTVKMEAQPYIRPAARKTLQNLPSLKAQAMASDDPVNELIKLIAESIRDIAKEEVPVDTGALRDSIEVVER